MLGRLVVHSLVHCSRGVIRRASLTWPGLPKRGAGLIYLCILGAFSWYRGEIN